MINLSNLLFTRSFRNMDGTVSVELAFNYAAYNAFCAAQPCPVLDPAFIPYLVFETMRGPKDNQNYLWNDKYSAAEAGTPSTTAGLGNIYENDNIRTGFQQIPEPGTLTLLALGAWGSPLVGACAARNLESGDFRGALTRELVWRLVNAPVTRPISSRRKPQVAPPPPAALVLQPRVCAVWSSSQ